MICPNYYPDHWEAKASKNKKNIVIKKDLNDSSRWDLSSDYFDNMLKYSIKCDIEPTIILDSMVRSMKRVLSR